MDKIKIYQFTDPVCVWCWGNEPVVRAIDYLYGEKVQIEFLMGGLVEEISTLYDLKGPKSTIIDRANRIMADNWLAASVRHGMPVKVDHNAPLFSERYPSSFPQNIAYEAARRIDAEAAKHFLRRIREATFTESRRTSQMDVLIELATECGIDAAQFIDHYTTGAQSDFMQSRMKCRRNGITGFPSYIVKNDSTKIILGGYQNLSTFHTLIGRLSGGKIKPRRVGPSIANITDFMRRYRTAYPVEIEVAFGLDRDKTDLIIGELIRAGKIVSTPIGEGRRLTLTSSPKASTKVSEPIAIKTQAQPTAHDQQQGTPHSSSQAKSAASSQAKTASSSQAKRAAASQAKPTTSSHDESRKAADAASSRKYAARRKEKIESR